MVSAAIVCLLPSFVVMISPLFVISSYGLQASLLPSAGKGISSEVRRQDPTLIHQYYISAALGQKSCQPAALNSAADNHNVFPDRLPIFCHPPHNPGSIRSRSSFIARYKPSTLTTLPPIIPGISGAIGIPPVAKMIASGFISRAMDEQTPLPAGSGRRAW